MAGPSTIQGEERLDVENYLRTKSTEYNNTGLADADLWDIFEEDFNNVTVEQYKDAGRSTIIAFKRMLINKGVYVRPHTKNYTVAQSLYETAHAEEYHKWTDAEIQEAIGLGATFTSKLLQRRSEASVDDIAQGNSTTPRDPQGNSGQNTPNYQQGTQPTFPPVFSASNAQNPLAVLFGEPEELSYSKELGNLPKQYTEAEKYGGYNDNLLYKLRLYKDKCNRAGVPQAAYQKGFSTMLKGQALTQYIKANADNLTFGQMLERLSAFFEGPGFQRKNLDQWEQLSLPKVMRENPDKKVDACLSILIDELTTLQYGLPHSLNIS